MTASTKIAELLAEVEKLQSETSANDHTVEIAAAIERADRAEAAAEDAKRAQLAAEKELAETKAAIAWTMGKLKIKDLFGARDSIQIGCAADGWLEGLTADPQDTKRIDFINKHGRLGIGQDNQFVFVLPSFVNIEEEIPAIYNARHFIDICMTTRPNGESA
jgi:hypothetical protein